MSPEPRVMGAMLPFLLLCIPGGTTRSPSCVRVVIIGGQEVLVRRDLGLGVRQVLLRFGGEFRACGGFVLDLTGATYVELLSTDSCRRRLTVVRVASALRLLGNILVSGCFRPQLTQNLLTLPTRNNTTDNTEFFKLSGVSGLLSRLSIHFDPRIRSHVATA